MVDAKNTALLAACLLALVAAVWQPLSRRHDDSDRGTDRLVRLPPFRKPSLRRLSAFLTVGLAVSTGIIGLRHPALLRVYHTASAHLLAAVDHDPHAAAYAARITPLIPAAVAGYLLTMAVVLPATIGRRLMILAHAPLFLAVCVASDTLIAEAGTSAGVPPGLVPIAGIYLEYVLGFMMIFRLAFTTYALPRPTRQPNLRTGDWRDTTILALCLLGSTGAVGTAALALIDTVGDHPLAVFVIIASLRVAIVDFLYLTLAAVKKSGARRPMPGPHRPAVDVIIPAYNEAVGIERLLRSIDRAAARYGGPVHVILCDDGSTDDTSALARAAIAAYTHASGQVILGEHGGKAKALNLALSRCTAEFVYRLDADCAIDADAFRYSIPHFLADPAVGLIGALTLPKEPHTTWIDRMRALEQLFNFASQSQLAEVDAVPCVLGSFMGFRRAEGLALGGFVSGMFGEDAEFTCALGRRGWRAVLDRRIVCYEDVPPTVKDLRVQRFRWGMGGMMNFARFTPFGNGAPGPRFWYQLPRSAGIRMFSPTHFFMLVLALQYAAIAPSAQHNAGKWAALLGLSFLPGLIPRAAIVVYYRRPRLLLWTPLWLVFALLKRDFLLEAALSVGVRPLRPPLAVRDRYPTWAALWRPTTRPGPPALGGKAPANQDGAA